MHADHLMNVLFKFDLRGTEGAKRYLESNFTRIMALSMRKNCPFTFDTCSGEEREICRAYNGNVKINELQTFLS